MDRRIQEVIESVVCREPRTHERITIIPLALTPKLGLDYLTVDDAIERGFAEIDEVSHSGSVPHMTVQNRAEIPVFIPDGTALVGSKQNRVVNLSILLAAASETIIPVSCVEQGRWSRATRKSSPREHSDAKLRKMMCRDANASLKRDRRVDVSQSGMWCLVAGKLAHADAASPSGAYHALFEKGKGRLEEYEKRLGYPDGACGVAVLIDGKVESVDLFDRPSTLERIWPKLVRSAAADAMFDGRAEGTEGDVGSFLGKLSECDEDRFEPVGIGTNVRFTGRDAVGAALLSEDTLIHLSVFAMPTDGTRSER